MSENFKSLEKVSARNDLVNQYLKDMQADEVEMKESRSRMAKADAAIRCLVTEIGRITVILNDTVDKIMAPSAGKSPFVHHDFQDTKNGHSCAGAKNGLKSQNK